jgi:hypothetical protein
MDSRRSLDECGKDDIGSGWGLDRWGMGGRWAGRLPLLHVVLVEDFLDRDELDDPARLLVEGSALLLDVGAVVEGDEE